MLIFAICLSLVPISAFAANPAVILNQVASIKQGGSVTISGTSTLDEVIIQVLRPGNTSTVYYDITKVVGGEFSSSFSLLSSEAAGTYKIIAGQGTIVDTKDLVVTQSDVIVPPAPPIDSVITPPIDSVITAPNETAVEANNLVTPPQTNANIVNVDASKNTVTQGAAANGHVTNNVTPDANALAEALAKAAGQDNQGAAPIIALSFSNKAGEGVTFNLPASVLADAAKLAPNTIISLQTNDGQYSLPISLINFAVLAESLATGEANISIQINISTVDIDLNAKIQESAKGINTSQAGSAIVYLISAAGNGKSVEINNFGTTYVERSIIRTLQSGADTSTVVLYDPTTGAFSFVPAVFNKQADGTYKITFKRNGNSIYTVLNSVKTFTDVSTHWAKEEIELLASKQIVTGATSDTFVPNSNITRAEFAALLVRSLGLNVDAASASFTDVKSTDWYAGAVGAAVKADLVTGYQDNSFKPNATITREQMAVMVARAISAAGKTTNSAAASGVLAKFSDLALISSWAQDAVAEAVEGGIINGKTDTTFAPSENATRAQAAVMLKRLLQYTSFIN